MPMTVEKLMDAMRLVKRIEAETGSPIYPTPFNGVRIIEARHALAETTERNFPVSRNRSKRIHKKLVKRYGGEFRKEPAIFLINGVIYAHPARYAELRAAFAPKND